MSKIITADKIHDGQRFLPSGTALEVADEGVIIAILTDDAGAEKLEGIICPGFVNTHCHLELSHMKGVIPEHTGLMGFLQQVIFRRNDFSEAQKSEARATAYKTMWQNGIAAIGDIANTTDTLAERGKEKIHFHTFVEALGFTEEFAQQRLDYSTGIYESFAQQANGATTLRQSIVPHAPYSVSPQLFELIDLAQPGAIISIHNQETAPEDQYYQDKTGDVNTLHKALNINSDFFQPSGKSSLQTYLPLFKQDHPFIFVHDTFTTAADVRFAQDYLDNCYWCLCPNANIYIENRLPDVEMLVKEGVTICIGTDSLSSNHQLSILSEIVTLKKHFPSRSEEELLSWATSNGAKALKMEDVVGSFATGTKPGVIQVTGWSEGSLAAVKRLY